MKIDQNNETLRAYLLKNSTDAEVEEFDALSITDEDFSNALNIAESDLIDSYLRNELDKNTREEFEKVYSASKIKREKVEFARALQIFGANELSKSKQKEEPAFFNNVLHFFSARNLVYASLIILLGFGAFLGFLLISVPSEIAEETPPFVSSPTPQNNEATTPAPNNPSSEASVTPEAPTSSTNSQHPTPITTESVDKTPQAKTPLPKTPKPANTTTSSKPKLAVFVLQPPMRGSGSLETISIAPETAGIKFVLQLESDEFEEYSVSLKNQAGKILWQNPTVPRVRSELHVLLPPKLLTNDIYFFTVSGKDEVGNSIIIGDYSFRTVLR
ncbi:MAG: hypothetical protein ACK5NT_15055 [Pyrinomonadaceae bacterium]